LGVILFALVSGRLPFDEKKNLRALLEKVKIGKFDMPENLSTDLQDLITKMLTVDPKKRINITEIKKHEWFVRMKKEIKGDEEKLEETEEKKEKGEDDNLENNLVEENDLDEEVIKTMNDMGFKDKEETIKAILNNE
jgi:serine/threonine protein kinase